MFPTILDHLARGGARTIGKNSPAATGIISNTFPMWHSTQRSLKSTAVTVSETSTISNSEKQPDGKVKTCETIEKHSITSAEDGMLIEKEKTETERIFSHINTKKLFPRNSF